MTEHLDKFKIEDCGLSTRAMNATTMHGFRTLGDLNKATDDQLLRLNNIGVGTVHEIRKTIASIQIPPDDLPDVLNWTMEHLDLVRAMINLEAEIHKVIAQGVVARET